MANQILTLIGDEWFYLKGKPGNEKYHKHSDLIQIKTKKYSRKKK